VGLGKISYASLHLQYIVTRTNFPVTQKYTLKWLEFCVKLQTVTTLSTFQAPLAISVSNSILADMMQANAEFNEQTAENYQCTSLP